jgi:hypothetical protein
VYKPILSWPGAAQLPWHANSHRWVLWLLDEVEPWLKWTLYDAIVALLVGVLVKRFGGRAETVFGLIGWL